MALIPEMFAVTAMFEGIGSGDGRNSGPGRPVRQPASPAGRAARWALDTSTPIVAGTYTAARGAVDVALTTVDLVLEGEATAAYGLCRPPGHHAARAMYGGYCFFNNAAIAAESIAAPDR